MTVTRLGPHLGRDRAGEIGPRAPGGLDPGAAPGVAGEADAAVEPERRLAARGRGGEPPPVGVRPLRVADAEQLAQRVEHGRDRAVRVGVVRAGDVRGRVRDEHRGAVAAAVAVVGDEGEHGMAVDERRRERRPRCARPSPRRP